ncbi:hypothetical protein IMZ48_36535 [Candidatus Bathyarchaeota archaeon]|nr:hypothetical protein [Candidatus Bathyarchaeota archaeon]
MVAWWPQPADSQQAMPTCEARPSRSRVEWRTLMISAAWLPFQSAEA